MWLPLSASARAGVDGIRAVSPGVGAARTPKASTRHYARRLLERAEDAAGVGHQEGSDFHFVPSRLVDGPQASAGRQRDGRRR